MPEASRDRSLGTLAYIHITHNIMFKTSDMRFEKMTTDTARRRAAITDLSERRTWFFWIAVVTSICMILTSWFGESGSSYVFVASMAWILFLDIESKVRLLRVIDRLHKSLDETPVA